MASVGMIVVRGILMLCATVAIWTYVQTEVNWGIAALYLMTCAIAIGQE
jgi:hypothetical protein